MWLYNICQPCPCGSGLSDSVSTPSCPCTASPRTLTMTVSKPLSNGRIFNSCTITFREPPAGLVPLGMPLQAYFSTTTFPDGITGEPFWYYLQCFQGAYVLIRLYEVSAYGSPFRDIIRYRWFVGLSGNTCSPFQLTNGIIFSGGDASCIVTITS